MSNFAMTGSRSRSSNTDDSISSDSRQVFAAASRSKSESMTECRAKVLTRSNLSDSDVQAQQVRCYLAAVPRTVCKKPREVAFLSLAMWREYQPTENKNRAGCARETVAYSGCSWRI